MTSLKVASRAVRDAAAQLAESRGLDGDALPSRADALLLLAAAALKELEAQSSASRETAAAAARSARLLLRPHMPRAVAQKRGRPEEEEEEEDKEEDNEEDKEEGVEEGEADLGQYAKTDVFGGDTKKRAKFARLMGGAKIDGHKSHVLHHHNTFVADDGTLRRINGELEEQFNAAVHRHGKKGLGA